MPTEIVLPVIVYLALFRLTIIVAGIVSIVLGYKLFCRGVWPDISARGEADVSVDIDIAGQRFTLKNAAPGTFFALFGVIIISVMFAAGPPEMVQDITANQTEQKKSNVSSFALRGAGDEVALSRNELLTRLKEAAGAYRSGDFLEADSIYESIRHALEASSDSLALLSNEWANRYLWESKNHLALEKAQLATKLRPDDADYIDTLIVASCRAENPANALLYLDKLVSAGRAAPSGLRQVLQQGKCPDD